MKQNDIGDISELIFENFTFVSPLLEVDTNRDMTPELIKRKNSSRDIKYWHILLIVIGLCIFLELKILLWIFSYNATSNGGGGGGGGGGGDRVPSCRHRADYTAF